MEASPPFGLPSQTRIRDLSPQPITALVVLAFALTTAARVRTLALIEVIFAQLVSLRMFREGVSRNELIGMSLIVIAVVVLINS